MLALGQLRAYSTIDNPPRSPFEKGEDLPTRYVKGFPPDPTAARPKRSFTVAHAAVIGGASTRITVVCAASSVRRCAYMSRA